MKQKVNSVKKNLPCRLRFFANVILLTFLIFTSIPSFGQAPTQTVKSYRSKFGPNWLVNYLVYVPVDYASNPSKNYPTMIFLHGAGEKAYNPTDARYINLVKTNGPPKLINQGQNFDFIVISPQCSFGDWNDVTMDNGQTTGSYPGQLVDEILTDAKKYYRVDDSKLYVTGLSMGGAGTLGYIENYGHKVAASIPIATWRFGKPCNIASNNIALWAFQGGNDNPGSMTSYVADINACTPPPTTAAKISVYSNMGHNVWDNVYSNIGTSENIYTWLLKFSKSSFPNGIYTVTNRNSGKVLEVKDLSTVAGTNIQQFAFGAGKTNQQWIVTSTGNGNYKFVANSSKLPMDVEAASLADGANIRQWRDNGTLAQRWKIEPTDNGYYRILNANSLKAMEVSSSSLADGANVQQWTFNSTRNTMQWKFTNLNIPFREGDELGESASSDAVIIYDKEMQLIQVTLNKYGNAAINLYDIAGKSFYVGTTNFNSHNPSFNIDLNKQNLPAGLYYLQVNSESESKTIKWFKE